MLAEIAPCPRRTSVPSGNVSPPRVLRDPKVKDRPDREELVSLYHKTAKGWAQILQVAVNSFGTKTECDQMMIKLAKAHAAGEIPLANLKKARDSEMNALGLGTKRRRTAPKVIPEGRGVESIGQTPFRHHTYFPHPRFPR